MTNEEKILELLSDLRQDVSGLKQDVSEIKIDIENRLDSQLQLLAEGQKTILDTLAPKSRVEALEDEIAFLKDVIRAHSKEIAQLKKAQ